MYTYNIYERCVIACLLLILIFFFSFRFSVHNSFLILFVLKFFLPIAATKSTIALDFNLSYVTKGYNPTPEDVTTAVDANAKIGGDDIRIVNVNSNTTILKTVCAFLANGKRNSSINEKLTKLSQNSKRRLREEKMNELSGKINPKTLEQLRKKTKFTKDELDALCRIYRKLVSNCQFANKTLTVSSSGAAIVKPQQQEGIERIVFRELLHSTFDIVTEEILMERMFCSWDKSHEGLPLRLDGWLVGLSVFLRGTRNEKAAFCFRVYDLNGDGFITKDEIFTLLRNSLIKQPQDEDPDEGVKDLVEIVLKKFDIDKDSKVSLNDFMMTVEKEPLLTEAFGQCLPAESAIISFFSTLQV